MSDAHPQGGDLFDMAKDGTKVPADAAKPNVIPAKEGTNESKKKSGPGSSEFVEFEEVVTAVGGQLPEDIDQKYSRHGGKERDEKKSAPHGGRNLPSH
ncbi:hypothetical protein QBC35DRAFT_443543 [Podospora australis]|uniref:Uncharacterized protein n=1 Tax=Podospora australis TaxID=1536484 RepID=A0AAN7AEV5_9PEZI|nr:hypothetical protein QBC35DRAFT_443543 [Podospora australis]